MVGKPFAKGRSGNPSGRPKIAPEVKELARVHTAEAIRTLAAIMKDKKSGAMARATASNSLLDRGYGKPTQHIDAHVDLIDRLGLAEQEALASALEVVAGNAGDASEGTEETHH